MPPYGINDLAWIGRPEKEDPQPPPCPLCQKPHPSYSHWGCQFLLDKILNEIKPRAHLFGHVHDCPGSQQIQGVTFVNAAVDMYKKVFFFDFYPELAKAHRSPQEKEKKKRIVVWVTQKSEYNLSLQKRWEQKGIQVWMFDKRKQAMEFMEKNKEQLQQDELRIMMRGAAAEKWTAWLETNGWAHTKQMVFTSKKKEDKLKAKKKTSKWPANVAITSLEGECDFFVMM